MMAMSTAAAGPGAITADYTLPFLAHACLEPMTATARISDGKCEVWVPTQSATLTTWAVAKALGLDNDEVTVYPTLLGGGFGRKVETDAAVQAALIARHGRQAGAADLEPRGGLRRTTCTARRWRRGCAGARRRPASAAWDAHVAVPDVSAELHGRNLPVGGGSPKASAGAIEGSVASALCHPRHPRRPQPCRLRRAAGFLALGRQQLFGLHRRKLCR